MFTRQVLARLRPHLDSTGAPAAAWRPLAGRGACPGEGAAPCYAMLCYAMRCYAMLCYAMLCHAMLCYAILCCAVL